MKRMRLIALLLAFAMIFVLTACDKKDADVKEAEHHEEDHDHDHDHDHDETFEWMGEYEFKAGEYTLVFDIEEDHDHVSVGMIEITDVVKDVTHDMIHLMEVDPEIKAADGDTVKADSHYVIDFHLEKGVNEIKFEIEADSKWALGFEHAPEEFNFKMLLDGEEIAPVLEHEGAHHEH